MQYFSFSGSLVVVFSFLNASLILNLGNIQIRNVQTVLLLRNNEGEIKAADCPFTSILITSADDYKTAVGRYVATAEDTVGKDNIVKYRKYIKDTSTADPQIAMIKSMQDGTGKFYHANPFFDLQTVSVSDDDTFLKRAALPF